MRNDDWRRYVGPAAFLLAVTIAVVLIRAGMNAGDNGGKQSGAVTAPRRHVTTTPAGSPAAARRRFWTVRAGDTFGVISTKTGVPVATIVRLNPKASSTSLHIGERVRLK